MDSLLDSLLDSGRKSLAGDHPLQHDCLADLDVSFPAAGSERPDVQLPPRHHRQLPAVPRHRSRRARPGEAAQRRAVAEGGGARVMRLHPKDAGAAGRIESETVPKASRSWDGI